MRARSASITDLPISPDEDRQRRFRMYLYLMLARVACLGIFFVVPDWWKLLPAFFAIFIPYFAVVIANVTTRGVGDDARIAPNALPPGSGSSWSAGEPGTADPPEAGRPGPDGGPR